MQLAAFLCDLCVICERIITQAYSSYCTKKSLYLSQITQIYADKRLFDQIDLLKQMPLISLTKTSITQWRYTVHAVLLFVCEIMQFATFLCVICVICERMHARGLKQSTKKKPQYISQITQIIADKPQ